jgi:hypothetical protein
MAELLGENIAVSVDINQLEIVNILREVSFAVKLMRTTTIINLELNLPFRK